MIRQWISQLRKILQEVIEGVRVHQARTSPQSLREQPIRSDRPIACHKRSLPPFTEDILLEELLLHFHSQSQYIGEYGGFTDLEEYLCRFENGTLLHQQLRHYQVSSSCDIFSRSYVEMVLHLEVLLFEFLWSVKFYFFSHHFNLKQHSIEIL